VSNLADYGSKRVIPLWLKIVYTVFVCILVPFYIVVHGWANFLWFSNVALLLTVATLWLENRLLPSMMALAVLIPEIGWSLDYISGLLIGDSPLGLAAYMFDNEIPLFVRGLSLYHLPLPLLLLWLVLRFGYQPAALCWQTLLAWVVLPLSYFASGPEGNVNWVYGFGGEAQEWMPQPVYLILLMIAFPILLYVPTHLFLKYLSSRLAHLRASGAGERT
jgi:hypothetical protein